MTQRRSILVTGCSSGIGHDAAHGLARAGWRVFATCRSDADCARLRDEGLESFPLDYACPDSIAAAVAETLSRTGGRLDALYNNGAFGLPGAVEDLPRDGLRSIFETNLFGVHDLTCRILPVMRAQGHGRIVNCSSVLGYVGIRWRGAYVATKFAMEGLTDVLRLELADTPIRVILLEPGPVTSDIRVKSIPHFERWIDWRGSAHRAQYEATLLKRLYEKRGPDRFELPARAVTQVLIRALDAPNPRPRYRITVPAKISEVLRRFLTTRMRDRVVGRS